MTCVVFVLVLIRVSQCTSVRTVKIDVHSIFHAGSALLKIVKLSNYSRRVHGFWLRVRFKFRVRFRDRSRVNFRVRVWLRLRFRFNVWFRARFRVR